MTNKQRRGWVAFNSNLKKSIEFLIGVKKLSRRKFDFERGYSEKELEDFVSLFRFELMRVQNNLARANYLLDNLRDEGQADTRKGVVNQQA